MGERAELLELIDLAPGPMRTLHGRWYQWSNRELLHRSLERSGGNSVTVSSSGGPPPPIWEQTQEVWLELPGRWRVEGEDSISVSDDITRWTGNGSHITRWAADSKVVTSHPLEVALHPAFLLGALQLDDPAAVEIGGRPARVVAAHRRGDDRRREQFHMSMQLPGDQHELAFDAETGLLVRHVGRIDGEVCQRIELGDLEVNLPMDPSLFTYEPGPDAEVHTEADLLLRMAEARGVDLSGVDTSDAEAIRTALQRPR
jgi:hypothetical protein